MTETFISTASDHTGPRRHTKGLMLTGFVGALFVLALTFGIYGMGIEGWQLASRYTGRFAFTFFAFVYLAGPLSKLWRNAATNTLMRNRRGLGLAFAMGFLIHGITFMSFLSLFGKSMSKGESIGGPIAFGFATVMMLTSNDWAVRKMGVLPWRWLQSIGVHLLAIMALIVYRGQASGGTSGFAAGGVPIDFFLVPQILLALLLLGVALHIVVFLRYLWRRMAAPAVA